MKPDKTIHAFFVSLLLIFAYFALLWIATAWVLKEMKRVPPLSWEAVHLTLAYAILVTFGTFLLLIALAIVLFVAELEPYN